MLAARGQPTKIYLRFVFAEPDFQLDRKMIASERIRAEFLFNFNVFWRISSDARVGSQSSERCFDDLQWLTSLGAPSARTQNSSDRTYRCVEELAMLHAAALLTQADAPWVTSGQPNGDFGMDF
mmetsp:Transcript_118469/g.377645  ORF Transcript_118469/g.377645 Transcript_118469/m.377645 type:complete len:124 (-) Transcript_118469:40-411(-)